MDKHIAREALVASSIIAAVFGLMLCALLCIPAPLPANLGTDIPGVYVIRHI